MIQDYAFDLAERFIGTKEISGQLDNPMNLSDLITDLKSDEGWVPHAYYETR